MNSIRRLVVIALVLLATALPALAQNGSAQVRFVHAIPGASAVDVYTDGQLTVSGLAYGAATNYIDVSVGSHHLAVTQAGSTNPIWEQDITPGADSALTLVASSAAQAAFQVYQDDLSPLALGKARFTAIHAIPDGPGVDIILADGRPVIPGLQYNQPYGTLDLPATSYDLAVVPAGGAIGDALVPAQPFKLNSGTSYMALVYGTGSTAKTLLLSAPARPDGDGGFVRIAHVIPGAPEMDVYLNSTLIAPSLAFGEATGYMALPAGSYTLATRAPGSTTDLTTSTFDVTAGGWQTALVTGNAETPALQVSEDVVSAVNETTSVLLLTNATSGATVSAANTDGSALLGDVSSGSSDSALLEPNSQGVTVSINPGSGADAQAALQSAGVYGGVYYSAVAVDGAEGVQLVQLPAVSLAQGTASAPGDQTLVAALPTLEPTVVAPTEVAVQLPTTVSAAAPTATTVGVEVLPQPTAAPTTVGPTAQVLLDPGVNLQLRQYPDRTAFSLGLAPSGSLLHVNGRAGEPVPPVGTTATPVPPEATPFVDPVTVLQEGEDLDPALTWINVTFDTPDGGTITAWVNALYVGIHDPQGRAMLLRNLPTVPSNQAGSAQNTALLPPSPREIVTMAIATNLDPGVRIHIRRVPSTEGESLALVPSGTQMEFVGVNEDRDWVFVRYTSPQSTVSGWVNVEFVTFQRDNQPTDFDHLQALNALPTVSEDQRGGIESGAAPTSAVSEDLRNVVAGTVTGLNPDANLHLRRKDSDQAESLALLPNGTTLTVTGRSIDDLWLQVSYQGQPGWVSSEYVVLTFNGQPYEMANLPVIDTSTPTPTPTETPQG